MEVPLYCWSPVLLFWIQLLYIFHSNNSIFSCCIFLKIWATPGLFFLYFRLFQYSWQKTIFNKNFADVSIRTADLWYRKRPLCQLSHHHFPSYFLVCWKNQASKTIDKLYGDYFPYGHCSLYQLVSVLWPGWLDIIAILAYSVGLTNYAIMP